MKEQICTTQFELRGSAEAVVSLFDHQRSLQTTVCVGFVCSAHIHLKEKSNFDTLKNHVIKVCQAPTLQGF